MTDLLVTLWGSVPKVATQLEWHDHLGTLKARLGVNRMDYRVTPGLYAVGNPTHESNVLLSSNYKLSFDKLRSQLEGRNLWILVLDTDGINVWCAAGKGTFGTDEVVHRIKAVRLGEFVSQRQLIAPQLSAPGVDAAEVKKRTGFKVRFGPVRAEDLPAFLDANLQAESEMRQVKFTLWDRFVLIPIELVLGFKYLLIVLTVVLLLSGISSSGYSLARLGTTGMPALVMLLAAFIAGGVITPLLLPLLPGKAFSIKGAFSGMLSIIIIGIITIAQPGVFSSWLPLISMSLLSIAISSYMGMNFTGASTYTSLSGVKQEMKIAVPIQIVLSVIGVLLWIAGGIVG